MNDISSGKQPIAKLECAMLPGALEFESHAFAGREVLWFVDNTVALDGIIKGSSREPVLEKLVA